MIDPPLHQSNIEIIVTKRIHCDKISLNHCAVYSRCAFPLFESQTVSHRRYCSPNANPIIIRFDSLLMNGKRRKCVQQHPKFLAAELIEMRAQRTWYPISVSFHTLLNVYTQYVRIKYPMGRDICV